MSSWYRPRPAEPDASPGWRVAGCIVLILMAGAVGGIGLALGPYYVQRGRHESQRQFEARREALYQEAPGAMRMRFWIGAVVGATLGGAAWAVFSRQVAEEEREAAERPDD